MIFEQMEKAPKCFLNIFFSFTLLLLIAIPSSAQFNYKVEGVVKSDGAPLAGATVSIFNFDQEKIKDLTTSGSGSFSFSLKPDEEYNMLITKPGFITERILYSTIGLSVKGAKFTGVSNPEIELFEMPEDPKLAAKVNDLTNKPVLSFYYSSDDNTMVGDQDIQESMKKELGQIKKQAEGPKAAAAEAAELEAKYKALIADADKLLAAKSYKPAKDKYAEASGLKPAEQYPKAKITEIDKSIADDAAREKALADAAAKEKADKEKAAAEAAEKDRLAKEKAAADAAAKAKAEQEKAAAEAAEKERLAKEKAAADAAAKEKADKEKAAAEARQKAMNDSIAKYRSDKAAAEAVLAQARAARDKAVADSTARFKADKAAAEAAAAQALAAKEKAVSDSIAKFKADKAAAEMAAAQARAAREKAVTDSIAKFKADKAAADAALAQARAAREKAVADSTAQFKAAQDKAAAEAAAAEQARIDKEKADAAAAAKAKADAEKAAADAAEKERLAKEAEKRDFENRYKSLITKGDSAIAVKNFPVAKTAFNDALSMKPDDEYSKSKLKDIDIQIANFDLYKNDLAKKYPVGITEEITKEGNTKVTRRIVVIENKGYLYEKKETGFGAIYYFKDGTAITEAEWKKNTETGKP